ncbi:hypothetical protein AAC387_Pa10g0197 [Persea americana]
MCSTSKHANGYYATQLITPSGKGAMSHDTSSSSSASTVQGSSHEGGLPPVTSGENGQPIGGNSVQLSSKIGEVVRTYVSPIYLKWSDVPNELKELVWEIVSHSFEVPEYSKRFILKRANNSWKDWKSKLRLKVLDKYQTDVERKSNIPEGVKKEDWERFVELNLMSEAHSLRQKGKVARKALKCPHTSGRKGQARVAVELQNPDGLVTRTQVYLATHGRKDGATGNQYLDEIDNLIQRDPTIVEKDLNHDPVALALGRDNRGRVRGLGMGVSKTTVHHTTPYRRYEMASQVAIKTAVDELKEQNNQLRERLEKESRERKRMEKRILSCLSQGQIVMQPSADNGSFSQERRDLPHRDAQSYRLMHLTRKSTCIAYGRVRGLSTEEEECYKVIVDEIIEGSVELIGGGKSFQDLTLGDTIDWPIFRTTFV